MELKDEGNSIQDPIEFIPIYWRQLKMYLIIILGSSLKKSLAKSSWTIKAFQENAALLKLRVYRYNKFFAFSGTLPYTTLCWCFVCFPKVSLNWAPCILIIKYFPKPYSISKEYQMRKYVNWW